MRSVDASIEPGPSEGELHRLAAILRCPIGHGPVRPLRDNELLALRATIARGEARHADGSTVTTQIDAGLVATNAGYVYPMVQGILVMLPARALLASDRASPPIALRSEKSGMQRFYDEIGWTTGDDRAFVDAQKWEDLRPVARGYIDRCHRRILGHLAPQGEFFLDAASGPVQYPQYLEYSAGYDKRICVDLSFVALREARRKLGARGVYILGDLTNLPLRDGVVDGGVSLHTIYHIPADEQRKAFEEVHRVLRPGATAAVVYAWAPYSLLLKLVQLPAKIIRAPRQWAIKLGRVLKRMRPGDAASAHGTRETPYFHAHSVRWFTAQYWPFAYEIRSWRSIPVPLMRAYAHSWLLGRAALSFLFRLEESFPRALGRLGAYPLIVIRKRNPESPAASASTNRRAA